eukprot:CAMPEP_0198223684 /NCGR_PEP_ID=MMETSP1445-20131203/93543_1 /TAXON_ID=36898 /ORGANISM="Pyramimonas sp., Strain CCMP2087" /LENGTH=69 /DNA_ID=CAMNT_0043902593 /DNA_START=513 /DNA_END=718 /DNA_ORIENTATION=-
MATPSPASSQTRSSTLSPSATSSLCPMEANEVRCLHEDEVNALKQKVHKLATSRSKAVWTLKLVMMSLR